MTLAQRLNHSRDRELAAARREGFREGQLSELVSQLEQQFGPLDEVSAARLAKANSAKLAKWVLRILSAESLDEVWS